MNNKRSGLEIVADVIREHYELGRVDPPEQMPMAHQRRHRKLVVNTALGKFVAKTYRRDPYVLDALRFQHRLSEHLLANDLPVAAVQPSRSGRRIVEIDDWALELQQFVEGELMRVSSETLAISGLALGKFHEVCRDFPRPERDARMWRFSDVPRKSFAALFNRARGETDDEARLNAQCNRIALFLRDAAHALSWDARNRFETGLIHGDWHVGNLIFKDERLNGILDLEFAGDGCYLEDLAYAASNLCVRTTMKPERLRKRVNILLNSYQKHRTLSFYEEAALYYAIGIKHIATVSYQMPEKSGEVAGLTASEWMERLAIQCEWLAHRAEKVRWGR